MTQRVVRSVGDNQDEVLFNICALHVPEGIEVDVTYGNGAFYKSGAVRRPVLCFDRDPQVEGVLQADCRDLPLATSSVGSVMFDPPFLTYVREDREGNGNMAMARRYSGFWRYDELIEMYERSISEASRVLRDKGVLVVKCQDIVHNHRLEPTQQRVLEMAGRHCLRLKDQFILTANSRMPSPNRKGVQRHSRIHHCYFIVLQKIRRMQ